MRDGLFQADREALPQAAIVAITLRVMSPSAGRALASQNGVRPCAGSSRRSVTATILTARLTLAIALFLFGTFLRADETPNQDPVPNPSEREVVIVPYNPKVRPADQKPDHLYLPYERFLQLWEAAKEHKRPQTDAEDAPLKYGLTSARYEARLEARGLTVTGQLDLFTGQAWVKIPLPFKDAKVSSLSVDGQAANWSEGALLVEKAGRHQVKIAFDLPRAAGAVDFRWGVPRATASVLALTLPQPETTATIEPGSGAVERLEGGARIVTAALGSAREVRVHLRTAEKPAAAGAPVSATVSEEARLTATWEEFQADVDFTFPSAVQDHFTVLLENGLTLTDLSAPNLKSWTLRPEGQRQALDLVLYEPAKEALTVHLATQRLPPAASPGPRGVPLFSTNAGRTELTSLALLADDRATATLVPAGGLRQISYKGPAVEGWHVAGAFAGAGTLQYQLAATPPRREAKVEYLYQVGRRQLELFASMELLAQGDPVENVRIELPPGFEVETLQSERPHTWWRADGSLIVSFQDATPASTRLVLHLVQKAPPAGAALEIRSLRFVDFHRVTSEVAVAAHMGVEAALTLPAHSADVTPAEAAASFQVLPPLQRKRGFRVADGDFSAPVSLKPLASRIEAVWALRAEAHEAWLGLSYAVRLAVKQGSIDQTRFTLPAALPEARVAGSDVREARSHIEGDLRVYEVGFQNEVVGTVEFTVDLEQPHTGGATLPALLFPGTPRASGYLLVENASEGEMSFNNTGLDKAAVAELPWEIPNAVRAQLFRVPPTDWTAKVSVERLEKAAGRLAFCPRAEFSTAFRRDGTAWHKAVWHLQNRALQFLPVRLPAGAELVSVRVAGQSVRADSGPVDGAPALLIPLIKTKPGELSYDVEAVYRTAEPALAGSANRTLDDPDLVGITVERTFWNIWAPAGFEIRAASGGNMERIIQEVAVADKLDDTLQELKGLNNTISLSRPGSETQALAVDNFRRLQNSLEQDQRKERLDNPESPLANAGSQFKGEIARQNGYVQSKVREVDEELKKQVQQLQTNGGALLEEQRRLSGTTAQPAPPSESTAALGFIVVDPTAAAIPAEPAKKGWKLNPAQNAEQTLTLNGTANAAPSAQPQQQVALNDNVVLNYNGNVDSSKVNTSTVGSFEKNTTNPAQPGKPNQIAQQPLSAARARNNRNRYGGNGDSGAPPPTLNLGQTTITAGTTISGSNTYTGVTKAGAGTLIVAGGLTEGGIRPDDSNPSARVPMAAPSRPGSSARPSIQSPFGQPPAPPAATPADSSMKFQRGTVLDFQGVSANPKRAPDFDIGLASSPDGGYTDRFDDGRQKPAATPPDRRITLAVDFPTEGEAIHFKKLKAAATVQVELAPRKTLPRWRNAFLLAIAGALLIWARRRFSREPDREFAL